MYRIEVHYRIKQMLWLFYITGLWPDNDRSGFRNRFLQVSNFTACCYYPIGLLMGSLLSENKIEFIFLGVASTLASVHLVRLFYFLWKRDQIIKLVDTLGFHTIKKKELNPLYLDVDTRIKRFVVFGCLFALLCFVEAIILTILALPFISNGKHLPLNIYFPLNWKENEIIYWFVLAFIVYIFVLFSVSLTSNVIIWYLMMSCAVKYEILANELKNIGVGTSSKLASTNKQKLFNDELTELIENHQQLQDITDTLKATFSNLFFIQILTSGLNICGTLFAIAFISTENPFVYVSYVICMVYIVFDMFMVAHFGNEIKYWSSRLSYSLFECDWLDQSETCKGCMIILMEVLKRPQLLIIGKLYPLDLQLFTKILNFAYSMFNVLKQLDV